MDFSPLQEYMNKVPEFGIPAGDIAVFKDHECLFRCTFGHRDYAGLEPTREDDMYNVYSCTKVVTVTAAMQLIEKGIVSLDDPVDKYIPAFAEMRYVSPSGEIKKAENKMTVYQLLTMTSGLGYTPCPTAKKLARDSHGTATTLEIISALAAEPLLFEPGTRWCYGRSHDVLVAVIEAATGMRYSDYLKENILSPLGMEHTTFNFNDPYVREHISALYDFDGHAGVPVPVENRGCEFFADAPNFESGGAGLITTTVDYGLLMDALANNGVGRTGARILTPESIEAIKTPRLDILMLGQFLASHRKFGYNYGLGVRTLTDPGINSLSPVGEFGWDGYTGGYGLVDTDNRIGISYMQNMSSCAAAYEQVFPETRNLVYRILGIK